jgi:isoquinoline 1-oxidoreductase subunit alpha
VQRQTPTASSYVCKGIALDLLINGATFQIDDPADATLLWVLRDELNITGTKYGCGIGICGACTVLLDGAPARSCLLPVSSLAGHEITTIEGLADSSGRLHPVQQAFIDHQVPQCGWCMSGQIMTAVGLLAQNPTPDSDAITAGMESNYCRCGCYVRIHSAVASAAQQLANASAEGRP